MTSSFLQLKNSLEGRNVWCHLIEIEVNASSTAYFTTAPDTVTYMARNYSPVPMHIGEIEITDAEELPQLSVDVVNFQGMAFRFAKDNDLSLNDVTIRLLNTTLTNSGADDAVRMQILGSVFTNEVGRFILGRNFSYEGMGPRRQYNRVDFPSIPYNMKRFAVI